MVNSHLASTVNIELKHLDIMGANQKYLRLWDFLIIYFSDPAEDNADDSDLVNKMVRDISPESLSFVKEQICMLRKEHPFPWQEIGKQANRYFENEVDAYEWLDEIMLALEIAS